MSGEPATEMPKYICHKRVWALQIAEVDEANEQLKFVLADRYAPKKVGEQWMERHLPQPGGYYVVYEDGYDSYSPKAAFESGYSLDRTSTYDARLLSTIEQAAIAYPPPKAEGK